MFFTNFVAWASVIPTEKVFNIFQKMFHPSQVEPTGIIAHLLPPVKDHITHSRNQDELLLNFLNLHWPRSSDYWNKPKSVAGWSLPCDFRSTKIEKNEGGTKAFRPTSSITNLPSSAQIQKNWPSKRQLLTSILKNRNNHTLRAKNFWIWGYYARNRKRKDG